MMKIIPETPCVYYIVYLIFICMLLCCWTNNKERRIFSLNRIGDVMVSVLASSAEDRGFEPRSGQAKNYVIVASPLRTQH